MHYVARKNTNIKFLSICQIYICNSKVLVVTHLFANMEEKHLCYECTFGCSGKAKNCAIWFYSYVRKTQKHYCRIKYPQGTHTYVRLVIVVHMCVYIAFTYLNINNPSCMYISYTEDESLRRIVIKFFFTLVHR